MFHTKLKSLYEALSICRKNKKKNFFVPSFRSPCILMNYISAATSNSVCTIRDVSLDRYIERKEEKKRQCTSEQQPLMLLLFPLAISFYPPKLRKFLFRIFRMFSVLLNYVVAVSRPTYSVPNKNIFFPSSFSPEKKKNERLYISLRLYILTQNIFVAFFFLSKGKHLGCNFALAWA